MYDESLEELIQVNHEAKVMKGLPQLKKIMAIMRDPKNNVILAHQNVDFPRVPMPTLIGVLATNSYDDELLRLTNKSGFALIGSTGKEYEVVLPVRCSLIFVVVFMVYVFAHAGTLRSHHQHC